MSLRKRRRPIWGYRPSRNSTTTTALEGLTLPPTTHWYPYVEDEFGDPYEPPEMVSRERTGLGRPDRYVVAA
jgi:hypothetical protein